MPREERRITRWAIEWRSKTLLEGERRRFMWDGYRPLLFGTREEAREAIKASWGYIAERKDLRREPHGWRMPRPVLVEVILRRREP